MLETKLAIALHDIQLKGLTKTYELYANHIDQLLEIDDFIDRLSLLTGNEDIIQDTKDRLTNLLVNLTVRLIQDEREDN